ncbi:hypothetical protein GCM10010398_69560 [Streptomyces fimbriatus]
MQVGLRIRDSTRAPSRHGPSATRRSAAGKSPVAPVEREALRAGVPGPGALGGSGVRRPGAAPRGVRRAWGRRVPPSCPDGLEGDLVQRRWAPHGYPVEVISHCVWLCFRFPLSFVRWRS